MTMPAWLPFFPRTAPHKQPPLQRVDCSPWTFADAGDHLNFVQWFIDFTKCSEIPLEAYTPYGAVELTEANNSIGAKWRAITKGASCSSWWVALQANGCGAN